MNFDAGGHRDVRPPLRLRFAFAAVGAAAALLGLGAALAQSRVSPLDALPAAEFHFARLVYADSPYGPRSGWRRGGWGRGAWRTDYPDAEYHLMQGINRLTRV